MMIGVWWALFLGWVRNTGGVLNPVLASQADPKQRLLVSFVSCSWAGEGPSVCAKSWDTWSHCHCRGSVTCSGLGSWAGGCLWELQIYAVNQSGFCKHLMGVWWISVELVSNKVPKVALFQSNLRVIFFKLWQWILFRCATRQGKFSFSPFFFFL